MLSIRLARVGRVNLPAYRIVVQEKTQAPQSKAVEIIGSYDPKAEPAKVVADKERLDYWLKAGAQPTLSLAELLIKQDLLKVEQAPIVQLERTRREASKKRMADKQAHKDQVAKDIKARNEAKQKAQEKPAAPVTETPKAEAKPEAKPEQKTEPEKK